MRPHEIKVALNEQLEGSALEYWNGMESRSQNEIIIHAQREGLDAAIQLVKDLAKGT